jgi:hypothetical protein
MNLDFDFFFNNNSGEFFEILFVESFVLDEGFISAHFLS